MCRPAFWQRSDIRYQGFFCPALANRASGERVLDGFLALTYLFDNLLAPSLKFGQFTLFQWEMIVHLGALRAQRKLTQSMDCAFLS
jgi:hypothetical protein